jgi:hypothetical protein
MYDDLHPHALGTGYDKMAGVWFSGLQAILPVADAGPDLDADEGNTVTLDGSGSDDPKGGNLSYKWQQTAGTAVVLSDDQAVQPTFTAPDVGPSGERLEFQLTVTDQDGFESTDTTGVNVHNPTSSSGGGGGGGGGGCFIGTAAYGPSPEFNVKVLRQFRDRFLLTSYPGELFVDLYYNYSAPVAHFITKHSNLKLLLRWTLMPLLGISWLALNLGPVFSSALLIFIVALAASGVLTRLKQRRA